MDDGKCDETKKERHYGVWDFGGGVLRLRSADVHFLAAIHGGKYISKLACLVPSEQHSFVRTEQNNNKNRGLG